LLLSAIGLILVAAAVRVPLFGTAYAASDTSHYITVANGLFGDGFPDNLRPPIYAFLLAVFDSVGVNPVDAAVLLQNLLGILLPVGVLLVAWRFFGFPVGLVAGFLSAASPLMIVTEQFALAENLFGIALFSATALLAGAVLRMRSDEAPWQLLVAAGAMFGIATLLRAHGLLALAAIPIALWIGAQRWRPALRASGVAVAAMLVVLAPWCIHNLIRFGDPNVSTVGNLSLYAHSITAADVPPSADSADGRLALSIYNTGAPPTPVFNALVAEGKTPAEATSAMGAIARDAIFRHPRLYLENTWNMFGEYRALFDPRAFGANQNIDQIASTRYYLQGSALSNLGEALPRQRSLPGDSTFTRVPWQVAQALSRLLYVVTIGGILVLLLPFLGALRQRLVAMTFLVVVLLGFLGSSLTAVYSLRYGIMFAPLVWILLAATLARILEVTALAWRQRPRLDPGQ
jgi:4-amino-4-deoxy-L-arabinose transferase-like glycosyltransferase